MKTPRFGALVLLGGLALIHCGGTTAGPGPGTGDGGGGGGGTCAPAQHRAVAAVCPVTSYPASDAGPASCATDADCAAAGSGLTTCRGSQCVYDACLSDSDCANGGVCVCSKDYYGGNAAYHPNVCVPSGCHVDADCGDNGVCAGSIGYCGSYEGFQCGSSTAPACGASGQSCNFSPEVGQFTCSASPVCNG
jgi:hypothetical protein